MHTRTERSHSRFTRCRRTGRNMSQCTNLTIRRPPSNHTLCVPSVYVVGDSTRYIARVQGVGWSHSRISHKSLKITDSKLSSLDRSYLIPLSGHVKTLHFTWPTDTTDPSALLDCFEQSGPHTLAIHSCELHILDEQTMRRCFAKFPCASITALELRDISASRGTFLILLLLFPNVDDLIISVNEWRGGTILVCPAHRVQCG